jgi:hypothetical protein
VGEGTKDGFRFFSNCLIHCVLGGAVQIVTCFFLGPAAAAVTLAPLVAYEYRTKIRSKYNLVVGLDPFFAISLVLSVFSQVFGLKRSRNVSLSPCHSLEATLGQLPEVLVSLRQGERACDHFELSRSVINCSLYRGQILPPVRAPEKACVLIS